MASQAQLVASQAQLVASQAQLVASLQELKTVQYNGTATGDSEDIVPPSGVGPVPAAGLPVTVGELRGLAGQNLATVLLYYQLGAHGSAQEKRARVRRKYGVGAFIGPGLAILPPL